MHPQQPSRHTIGILGTTQIASWGSLYYAFAILAPAMQREFGWRAEVVFGAFSWSLLVAGVMSAPIGVLLDRRGGRAVMGVGSLLCALGFMLLGATHSIAMYFVAWTVLGIAMSMVLYEAAFATINRTFIDHPRTAISTLTLFGGFASTLFWPLTLQLEHLIGWRASYYWYAGMQLLLCAPLHALLPPAGRTLRVPATAVVGATRNYALRDAVRHPAFWKLALAFSANSFVFSAMSVHLIPLLHQFGHAMGSVVVMAALIGPMQVVGRVGEMILGRRTLPQTVGTITFAMLPMALVALMLLGEHRIAAAVFCMLYGLSNGILTIVRGTIPQVLFGREHYGAISGALSGPALVAKAAGPLVIAAMVQVAPSPTPLLGVLLVFSLGALLCYLVAIRSPKPVVAIPAPLG